MWQYLSRYADELGHVLNRMDRIQWLIVFAAAVLVGFLCMRGFGSRTRY